MTDVLEVLLELEFLRADLVRHPLKVDSQAQSLIVLERLLNIMSTILRNIISKDSLDHLEQISSGGMTSTNT